MSLAFTWTSTKNEWNTQKYFNDAQRNDLSICYEWVLQISVETIQIRTDLSARRQNMPGWLDVLITL